jgi:hypothetical protein
MMAGQSAGGPTEAAPIPGEPRSCLGPPSLSPTSSLFFFKNDIQMATKDSRSVDGFFKSLPPQGQNKVPFATGVVPIEYPVGGDWFDYSLLMHRA